MGFDEAKVSVRVLLIMTAAYPEAKMLVCYRYNPAPVLRERFAGVKALGAQSIPKKLG